MGYLRADTWREKGKSTSPGLLRHSASLCSVTDTLNYNWDYAYVNEFPVAVEDLDVDELRTTARDATGFF